MANPVPTPVSSPVQSREAIRALVGEYMDQKQREEREAALVEGSLADAPRRLRLTLMIVAAVTTAIVWILPSFVQPEDYTPTPQHVEASARMTLFLAAERVRSFKRSTGRLPISLADAGVDTTGLTYFRSSENVFDMWMTANGRRIIYHSTVNNVEFLGATLQTLSGGR